MVVYLMFFDKNYVIWDVQSMSKKQEKRVNICPCLEMIFLFRKLFRFFICIFAESLLQKL